MTDGQARRKIRDRAKALLDRTSLTQVDRIFVNEVLLRLDHEKDAELVSLRSHIDRIAKRVSDAETGTQVDRGGADPVAFVKNIAQKVPAMKFALAVMALAVTAAFVIGLMQTPADAMIGMAIILAFMVLVVVFRRVALLGGREVRMPALVVAWACVCLFVGSSILLFTSVFFGVPTRFSDIINELKRPWTASSHSRGAGG